MIKISASSVRAQREMELAIENNDREKAHLIMSIYIDKVLRNGLSIKQKRIFNKIWHRDQEGVRKKLVEAFSRGWAKPGATNFSKALQETLLEAVKMIKDSEKRGDL